MFGLYFTIESKEKSKSIMQRNQIKLSSAIQQKEILNQMKYPIFKHLNCVVVVILETVTAEWLRSNG